MKIGNLLVGCRIRVVDCKVDFGWVPELLNPHLVEYFNRKGPCAVLGHGKVCVYNRDVAGVEGFLSTVGSRADHLLSEG